MNPNGATDEDHRYLSYRLRDNFGNATLVRNHRIAALHFVPNPKPNIYNEVNHKDGDRMNNHVSNFEWTTHRANTLHGRLATRGDKSSKYKGVSYVKPNDNWRWAIYNDGQHIRRFGFTTEELAYESYRQYHIDNGLDMDYI